MHDIKTISKKIQVYGVDISKYAKESNENSEKIFLRATVKGCHLKTTF